MVNFWQIIRKTDKELLEFGCQESVCPVKKRPESTIRALLYKDSNQLSKSHRILPWCFPLPPPPVPVIALLLAVLG